MKNIRRFSLFILFMVWFIPTQAIAQLCEPIYSVERVQAISTSTGQTGNNQYNMIVSVGQPMTIMNTTNYSEHDIALGFWGPYLKEPAAPLVRASDGDFQNMVLVDWDIEGDRTGPPVTSDEVTLYRNDYILTTLPAQQTQYQDFNVFPGASYYYSVSVENDMGVSHTDPDVGFLNPNGMITGHIETPSGYPVIDTKVMLTPNLGLSAKFNGNEYIYWFDGDLNTNRQFNGFENDYTLETWFRSVHQEEQVLFAAVDSASTDHYITVSITGNGAVKWSHQPIAGDAGTEITTVNTYAGPGEEWHHLAVVYADSNLSMSMYIDGFLVGENTTTASIDDQVELIIGKQGPREPDNYYQGRLDDFRMWNIPRKWDDLRNMMDITLSGEEPGLVAYWKFDEGDGETVFDLTSANLDGATCNVERDSYIAPVYLGAITNEDGNYVIKGIYYADGMAFTVTPSLASPTGRSLKFDGTDDFIRFDGQRVNLTAGYTLEGWFKTPSSGDYTIIAAVDPADDSPQLSVYLEGGQLNAAHLGAIVSTSVAKDDNLWHHYAVTSDNVTLTLYVDGESIGTAAISSAIPVLSEISIARLSPMQASNYYQGYLDEMRLWNAPRNLDQVNGTMNQTLEGDEFGLTNYWRLNDGKDSLITDASGTVTGTISGADAQALSLMWHKDIPLNEYFDHWYEPGSRNVALNNSNTAVNAVDFTDESMIPVSGYVRYENTACLQEGVEIFINGARRIPPLFTDEDGKFILEMEPGSTGDLITCSYDNHEFLPPLLELPMIVQPIAGLFFDDKTAYDLSGYVAGGSCKYPITPDQGQIEVTITSVSGCFTETVVPDASTGLYEFSDLPPLIFNISVSHPDPSIEFAADTISLKDSDRTREFIHHASPEVEFVQLPVTEIESVEFPLILHQRQLYQTGFEVFELYGENRCMIEKFNLQVFDNISDTTYTVDLEGSGTPHIQFTGNKVNLLSGGEHPYQQNLQIVITDTSGRTASTDLWALVEGDETIPGVNFSTTTSKMPWYVLRVPPGDGSSAYMSADETICHTSSTTNSIDHAGHANATAHLGNKTQIVATAGLGVQVGTITEMGITFDIGANFSWNQTTTDIDETCNCLTTSETYSTSGDGLTGDDATVFIGGGNTVDMGLARYIYFDENSASVQIDTVITLNTTGVTSTYIHSKYYVKNVLMPDLWMIYILNDDQDALADFNYWQEIIDQDSIAMATAEPNDSLMIGPDGESSGNISFDAGASLEYSYATEATSSHTHSVEFTDAQEFFVETGFDLIGAGWDLNLGYSRTSTDDETDVNDTTKSRTIGFVLDDDDPGDGFAFSVKSDPYWGMPVFNLIGGQSSCPWEEGSFRRQVADIAISDNLLVDVPPDDVAVFTLMLGNNSDTGEAETYVLTALNESNPDGAFLFTTENLAGGISYTLEAAEVLEVTLQVSRGPEAYEYDNLTLDLSPACGGQDETSSQVSFSVHFQEPCSESNIASLEDGWLVDGSHGSDTLWVTVNGYDWPLEPIMLSIDLQYRAAASGGDWFTAASIAAADINEDYILMPFIISPDIIIDGTYEIRSQALCTGDAHPGTSPIVSGMIDRTAPLVLGLPEPIDGILGPDDLIRVTLNEDIACGEINPGAGDIMLFNTVNGNSMDYSYTCGGNVITFEPNVPNMFIENQTFRAEIHNLQDIYGNTRVEPIIWEFYVNRNPIEWLGTNVEDIVLYVDEEYSTTRQLINGGGSNRSWEMIGGREGAIPSGAPLDIPTWLEVSPLEGTLTPGSSQDVSISLAEGLNFGEYSTTIYAAGTQGDEALVVDIRKLCHEPEWTLDATDFQYSMNITANLLTDDVLSSDIYDRIAVFVGEELRGVSEIIYMEGLAGMPNIHPYQLFLTVYSNESSGEDLTFRVWDASECRELGWIEEFFTFSANTVFGTPTNPETITATSKIIANHVFSDGWNWMSMNLVEENMSLNSVTQFMGLSNNDLIKSQTDFSMYVDGFGWVGTLDTLLNENMYQLKLASHDTLMFVGYEVDPELDTIAIESGWNWIGYLPQVSYPVDYALETLPAATGDLIKSQFAYAQYVEGVGWLGNLTYLDPQLGYLLKSLNEGELIYPFMAQPLARPVAQADFTTQLLDGTPDWAVRAQDYEFTMNITGLLFTHDSISADAFDMVGAFVGDECRGVAQPVFIEALDQYMVFMTVYGSSDESDQVMFRAYNADADEELYVEEALAFVPNEIIGNVDEPFIWGARYLGIGDAGFIPDTYSLSQNYPNPFNPVTTMGFGLPEDGHVSIRIYNLLGQEVHTLLDKDLTAGYRFVEWNSLDDAGRPMTSGIYLVVMQSGNFREVKKILMLK